MLNKYFQFNSIFNTEQHIFRVTLPIPFVTPLSSQPLNNTRILTLYLSRPVIELRSLNTVLKEIDFGMIV